MESNEVYLPPQPIVQHFNLDCQYSNTGTCFVSTTLGPVDDKISAISINGHYLNTLHLDEEQIKANSSVFNYDMVFPDEDNWSQYEVSSTFSQIIRTPPGSITLRPVVRVSIAYLSTDLARLFQEIQGTYAIGEDIFANLVPFHSNFNNAFGVFGLYNEDVRIIKL